MKWLAFLLMLTAALAAGSSPASQGDSDNSPPQPESPALRALANSLTGNDARAVDSFWQQIQQRHAPLIEAVPGHPDDALFTFLWKAEPGQVALNVLFNGWFPLHAQRGFDSFTRLGDSNV